MRDRYKGTFMDGDVAIWRKPESWPVVRFCQFEGSLC